MSQQLPKYIIARGKRYTLCAALVNTEQEGAPSNLTLLTPNRKVTLAGGEKFITLYVPDQVLPMDWDQR